MSACIYHDAVATAESLCAAIRDEITSDQFTFAGWRAEPCILWTDPHTPVGMVFLAAPHFNCPQLIKDEAGWQSAKDSYGSWIDAQLDREFEAAMDAAFEAGEVVVIGTDGGPF